MHHSRGKYGYGPPPSRSSRTTWQSGGFRISGIASRAVKRCPLDMNKKLIETPGAEYLAHMGCSTRSKGKSRRSCSLPAPPGDNPPKLHDDAFVHFQQGIYDNVIKVFPTWAHCPAMVS